MSQEIDFEKVNRVCSKALDIWGERAQLAVAQEECGELIVAISHVLRHQHRQIV